MRAHEFIITIPISSIIEVADPEIDMVDNDPYTGGDPTFSPPLQQELDIQKAELGIHHADSTARCDTDDENPTFSPPLQQALELKKVELGNHSVTDLLAAEDDSELSDLEKFKQFIGSLE